MSRVSIGGIIGSGYLDISVPGEDEIHSVLLDWSLGIGFYIYLIPIVILLFAFSISVYHRFREKK
jgi:hypothetical protein